MNLFLAIFAIVAMLTWGTWVFFACIMNLKRVRALGELTALSMVFGYPTLLVGYILDLALNITLATLVFLELPREPLFSARLQRLTGTAPQTWRGRLALWLRRGLLDNIDPAGIHHG